MLLQFFAYVQGCSPVERGAAVMSVLLYRHIYSVCCWEMMLYWGTTADAPFLVCPLDEC